MECALVSTLPEGPDCTYEVKLDGYRAIGVRTSRETDPPFSERQKLQQRRSSRVVDQLACGQQRR